MQTSVTSHSNYSKQQKRKKNQFLGKLVQTILDVDENDENYEIAYQFCQENTHEFNHRFQDTNKDEIKRIIQG
jgi:hypothetical protein